MMPVRKKPDGRWYYRKWVKLPHGGRIRVFGTPREFGLANTKAACEEALRRKLRALLDGDKPKTSTAATPLVREFVTTYLEHSEANNKPSTHETKVGQFDRHILPELGAFHVGEIGFAHFEDLKQAMRQKRKVWIDEQCVTVKPLGPKSINNVMSILRDMLYVASKREIIASIPDVEWLDVGEQDFDFLTFDEAKLLVRAADAEWHAMIVVALRCGLRQGELLGLQWSDLDLKKGLLRVKRNVYRGRVGSPKGGKWRDVPLSDDAIKALKAHRHLRSEWVFCTLDGRRLTENMCRKPLARIVAEAGLRHLSWHVLRHTFASHLAMRGVPLRHVQQLMGHSTIQMTERYAHLTPDVTRDAVRLLDARR
jgi:integrase